MPNLDYIRVEIEHMRAQVGRQRKEILQLQKAGIATVSAEALLGRMLTKIDGLSAAGSVKSRIRFCSEQGARRAESGEVLPGRGRSAPVP